MQSSSVIEISTLKVKKQIKNDPDMAHIRKKGMENAINTNIVSLTAIRRSKAVSLETAKNNVEKTSGDWPELVNSIAENQDRAAFRLIFDYYGPRVKSFMLRSGCSEGLAEEIAQETLLTVWHKAALYHPERSAVSTWIFTIARNKKVDRLRKDSRPLPDVNDPSFHNSTDVSPESSAWHSESAHNIRKALSELPDDQREALKLAFLEENSHSKIAEILDVPLGTVKSRIRLGLERLRALLKEHSGDFS